MSVVSLSRHHLLHVAVTLLAPKSASRRGGYIYRPGACFVQGITHTTVCSRVRKPLGRSAGLQKHVLFIPNEPAPIALVLQTHAICVSHDCLPNRSQKPLRLLSVSRSRSVRHGQKEEATSHCRRVRVLLWKRHPRRLAASLSRYRS